MAERSRCSSSHSRVSGGSTRQWLSSLISSRTRRARKVESANLEPPHDGILAGWPVARWTRTSTPVTPTSFQTWPAKMKVSPGSRTSRYPSSTSPSLRPGVPRRPAIRTLEHGRRDDGADVHAVAQRGFLVPHPPEAILALHDAAIAVVGLERIAAGRDEVDDLLVVLPAEVPVWPGGPDLVVERDQVERLGAARTHHVLGQHVERAGAFGLGVERVLGDRFARGLALQHFEAVGRDEERAAGLVQAVIGAADALDHARGALGRGELDDEVDVTPVDAKIQRGGANDGAQRALGHRRFDLASLLGGERTVVKGDRQVVVIQPPELLEGELGLEAGVDENERRAGFADRVIHLGHGVVGGVPRPRHLALGKQDIHDRRSAGARR